MAWTGALSAALKTNSGSVQETTHVPRRVMVSLMWWCSVKDCDSDLGELFQPQLFYDNKYFLLTHKPVKQA